MSTLRAALWSALGLILLIVAGWSFVVLFLQIACVSVIRAETQLGVGFSPVHLGCQGDTLSLPKPGIRLQPDRSQRIGERDLTEWLQLHQNPKNHASDVREGHGIMNGETGGNLRVETMARGVIEIMFPVAGQDSRPVIVLILIPPNFTDSLSARWGTNPQQAVSGTSNLLGIPTFKVSETGK